MKRKNRITIVGSGYVGMSLAALLSNENEVIVLDIDAKRIDKINNNLSTIPDNYLKEYLLKNTLDISGTLCKKEAYTNSNFIIIATPTDYNIVTNGFDTSSVDSCIKDAIKYNKKALIVIKSTLPIGHTDKLRSIYNSERIIFSPEFLREGSALYDNLYPSRIIIGGATSLSKDFGKILNKATTKKNVTTIFMPSSEAEAVKLFANTYLAMRVSFFNELDSFALVNNLDSRYIIDGVSSDARIGAGYNNPSFGYGGYCLPKDTKQLLSSYEMIPQDIIKSIVESNITRKDFISSQIINKKPSSVGIYRLVMKEGSENSKFSAILDIVKKLIDENIRVYIYEPLHSVEDTFNKAEYINDFNKFVDSSDLIIANRNSSQLDNCRNKVFTRDLYGES